MELRRLIGYGNMISCLSTNDGVIKDLYSPTWYNTDAEQVSIADNDRFGKVIDINNCEKGIYVSASDLKLFGIQEFTIGFWQNVIELDGSAIGFSDDNFNTMLINDSTSKGAGSFAVGTMSDGSRYPIAYWQTPIKLNEWAHYCMAKYSKGYRFYINGKEIPEYNYNHYDSNNNTLVTKNLNNMYLSSSTVNASCTVFHTQTYNFFMSSKGIDVTSFEITKPVIGLMYKEYDENGNIYSI